MEVREKFLEQTGRGKGPLEGVKSLPPSVVESLLASSSSSTISSDALPVPTEVPSVEQGAAGGMEVEERLKVVEESLRTTDERLKAVGETLQKTQESLENINRILATFSKHLPVDALD
ncbi:hypothetical protein FA13DRAFT_1804839 [Coprinellus micaceus]|nr:hypothetical protein FA13DRAFT_1804839 [Coprinellus micaceus]